MLASLSLEVAPTGAVGVSCMAQNDTQLPDPQTIMAILDGIIRAGKEVEEELRFSEAAGLAPARTMRARRKSRELQEEFLRLMGPHLEAVFYAIDTDASGSLDHRELSAAFEALGRPASDESVRNAIAALDANNDGVISIEEFKAVAFRVNVER